jgi:hypothetical protein
MRCMAQSQDFCMSGWILLLNGAIVASADNLSIKENDCPNGHFSFSFGFMGFR